jgi:hypothetical protein
MGRVAGIFRRRALVVRSFRIGMPIRALLPDVSSQRFGALIFPLALPGYGLLMGPESDTKPTRKWGMVWV